MTDGPVKQLSATMKRGLGDYDAIGTPSMRQAPPAASQNNPNTHKRVKHEVFIAAFSFVMFFSMFVKALSSTLHLPHHRQHGDELTPMDWDARCRSLNNRRFMVISFTILILCS